MDGSSLLVTQEEQTELKGQVSEQELAEHTGENIYRSMTSVSRTEV